MIAGCFCNLRVLQRGKALGVGPQSLERGLGETQPSLFPVRGSPSVATSHWKCWLGTFNSRSKQQQSRAAPRGWAPSWGVGGTGLGRLPEKEGTDWPQLKQTACLTGKDVPNRRSIWKKSNRHGGGACHLRMHIQPLPVSSPARVPVEPTAAYREGGLPTPSPLGNGHEVRYPRSKATSPLTSWNSDHFTFLLALSVLLYK